jgi:hypothetical protein
MKRANSSSSTPSASTTGLPNNNQANQHTNTKTPASATTPKTGSTPDIEVAQKSEVLKLQQKLEEMTKNMDALTEMVQKVSLQQQQQQGQSSASTCVDENKNQMNHNKRKKTEQVVADMPDPMLSNMMVDLDVAMEDDDLLPIPDIAVSSNRDLLLPNPPSESIGLSSIRATTNTTFSRQNSNASTDSDFVDQIFSAFNNDEEFLELECNSDMIMAVTQPTTTLTETSAKNRPDPELMQRLGEALELLPKSTQELIINRLIDAILNTEGLHQSAAEKDMPLQTTKNMPPLVVDEITTAAATPAPKPLGLAAATFQALLEHYSSQNSNEKTSTKQSKHSHGKQQHPKCIPVIPVHA